MSGNHPHTHLADLTLGVNRRLGLALALTLGFVVVEVLAGLAGKSLALLTDAAHNLTDVFALGISWIALRLATQPAQAGRTYGYHRAGILAALINSTTLVLISLGIFYEAFRRFSNPPEVNAPILIGVGTLAFLVNAGTAWMVHRGSDHDLNLRSAFLHLLGDVLSTLGAVAAGIVILFTGWNWLDPLVSILIGILILWNAWGILCQTVHILLESTPDNIDLDEMVNELIQLEGVRGVHDLHVWSISESLRVLSAHIVTADIPISAGVSIQKEIVDILERKYNIRHATLQLECENCEPNLLFCDITEPNHTHEDAQTPA